MRKVFRTRKGKKGFKVMRFLWPLGFDGKPQNRKPEVAAMGLTRKVANEFRDNLNGTSSGEIK
jgi:hypothetical protein